MREAPALTAAALSAVAVLLVLPRRPHLPQRRSAGIRTRGATLRLSLVGPVLIAGALLTGVRGTHLGLVAVGVLAGAGALGLVARARRSREADLRRQQVVDYCEALAGELRAGQPVLPAVERATGVWPEAVAVVAAVRLGADVPAALRRLATSPGAHGVSRLAAAWELCSATGSGLAFAVEQVLETARAEQRTARLVQGELAAARATARLVTALPVVVLVAAEGLGAHAWRFLLATPAGVVCLGVGVAFGLLGLWWIDRIATTATDGAW